MLSDTVHSVFRSPGGTPLISAASLDSGEGLTPLMTRALRQKFKVRMIDITLLVGGRQGCWFLLEH